MSDLFHKDIPTSFVSRVFDEMEVADWHTYQILTKRSSLLQSFINGRYRNSPAPRHVWLGVSVEDRTALSRVEHLRHTRAPVRFLSIEPLLDRIGPLSLEGIHWVIVGGESGPGFRPMRPEWAREIRDQCLAAEVPFFFKQWGGVRPKSGGRLLDRKEWSQYPRIAPSAGALCGVTAGRVSP